MRVCLVAGQIAAACCATVLVTVSTVCRDWHEWLTPRTDGKWRYVRTYVCMYVCMYVRMYVCVYVHMLAIVAFSQAHSRLHQTHDHHCEILGYVPLPSTQSSSPRHCLLTHSFCQVHTASTVLYFEVCSAERPNCFQLFPLPLFRWTRRVLISLRWQASSEFTY